MTWTLNKRISSLVLAMLVLGCNGGPMAPGTSARSVPAARTGAPDGRPPIANQPLGTPGTTSSVQMLPFATLPSHAVMQAQNGGVRPLAMLASNGQTIDGRSVPYLSRSAQIPGSGGAKVRPPSIHAEASTPQSNALAGGLPQSPQEDLRYRGGRTIKDLTYVNIYVGGTAAWDPQDWRNIDKALAAAMSDQHLNNVVMQYFNNQPVSCTFKGSFFMSTWKPTNVPKSLLEQQVSGLYQGGAFKGMDLQNTVINFMLPRGAILGDPSAGQQSVVGLSAAVPKTDAEDSTGGLGGYHGSVHANGATVYYAVGVYSERLPNGGSNGIPVFDQNWKNVVATFYHELQEARTDPDVGDAVAGIGPNPAALCGWTSDSGNEIGDYPIAEARQLSSVFVEIPLADGSGMVPIQLNYSNAVHGPEGPIAYPHGMEPPPGSKPPANNPPINSNPPSTTDPELARLVASWGRLEDFVKKAIIRLASTSQ